MSFRALSLETVVTDHDNTPESDYIRQRLYALDREGASGCGLTHISLYLRDADGNIRGGLLGQHYWNCMMIDVLWIDPAYRRMGYGRRLMNEIEAIAVARGIDWLHLDSPAHEVPAFYARLGFEVFGVMQDTPRGYRRYFLAKRLK